MINRKIPWTSQPQYPVQIDWSNPLTKGLRAAVNGTLAFDYVTNKFLTVGSAGVSNTPTPLGMAHTITTASGNSYIELPFELSGAVTVVAILSRDASVTAASDARKIASIATNKPAGESTFWTFNAGNGFGAAGDFDKPRFSTNAAGIGTIYLDGVALSGNNPATTALVNGQFYVAAATVASGASSSGAGVTRLMGGYAAAQSIVGRMPLALLFNVGKTADEIKRISDNPWQIFKAPSRKLWVSAGGGTDTPVNPAVGSIAITGYAPAVAQTANQSIAPNVGNIVITGYAPSISQPLAVNPAVGSLAITGYAPTVTQNVDFPVNPGVGTIAITGYAPTVSQTANQSILPAVGNVAITGYAPAVSQPLAINPTVGTLAITGYAPTIAQSVGTSANPDVGSITITGYSPTVAQSESQSLVPDVGLIAITGYAPTVKISSPLGGGRLKYWNGSAWVN